LVIFLRGVNVGGHRTFRPSILANELKEFGVVNIGAAGTLVVRKPVSEKKLRAELAQRLSFETEIMICTGQELIAAASGHPFGRQAPPSDIVRLVIVLAKPTKVPLTIPVCIPENGRWLLRVLSIHDRFLSGVY